MNKKLILMLGYTFICTTAISGVAYTTFTNISDVALQLCSDLKNIKLVKNPESILFKNSEGSGYHPVGNGMQSICLKPWETAIATNLEANFSGSFSGEEAHYNINIYPQDISQACTTPTNCSQMTYTGTCYQATTVRISRESGSAIQREKDWDHIVDDPAVAKKMLKINGQPIS